MLITLAILMGYILGSVSPSFILGKLLKGIDIREHGDGNAGAANTKRVLGLGPAILVTIYDLSKGLIAMIIAFRLGLTIPFIYVAGFAAILGHVLPFYLKFRGGQGAATAAGILIFSLIYLIIKNYLPIEALIILAIASLAVYFVTRIGDIVGLVVMPMLIYFVFSRFSFATALIGAIIAAIIETIPLGVNDNLSVGLTFACAMYIMEAVT